ncbi:MAG: SdrD B-like domain-containing protein [Deinococcaceae bacterium]
MYKQHLSLATALILSGLLASCAGSVSTGKPVDNPTSAQSNSLKIFTFTDLNEDGVFKEADGERLVEGIRMQVGYKGGVQDCYSGTITGASSCVFDASTLPDDTYYLSIKAVPTGIPGFLRTLMNQYAEGWNVIENGQVKWVNNIFFDKSQQVVAIGDQPVKLPTDIPSQVIQFKKNQPQAKEVYFPIPVLERAPKPDMNGRSNYVESVGHATTRIQNTLAEGRGYIMGVLTDTSGKPLPGMPVYLSDSLAVFNDSKRFEFQGIKTDSDGRFVFSYVPAGTYDLYVPTGTDLYFNNDGAAPAVKLNTGIVVQQGKMTDLGRPQLTKDPSSVYSLTPCIDRDMDGLCDLGDGKLNIARDLQFPRADLPLPNSYLDQKLVGATLMDMNTHSQFLFAGCENGLCFTVLPKNRQISLVSIIEHDVLSQDFGVMNRDKLAVAAAIPDANPIQYLYDWRLYYQRDQMFVPPSDNICNIEHVNIEHERIVGYIYPKDDIEAGTYFPEYHDGDAIQVIGSKLENESLPCYASGNFDFVPFEDKNTNGTWDSGEPRIPEIPEIPMFYTKSVIGNATMNDPRFNIMSYSRLGPVDPSTGMNTLRTRMVQFSGQSQTMIYPSSPLPFVLRPTTSNTPSKSVPFNHTYVPNARISYWGYAFPGTVRVNIFEDVNADKNFSAGDTPLANVKVRVTDRFGEVREAQTDTQGNVALDSISAGKVQIEVVKETLPNADKRVFTETSGSGFSKTITLTSSGKADLSFGYKVERSGQLEGVLFDDSNGNGAQDPGELGISGVTLTAIRGDVANVSDREQQTKTDPNGKYVFDTVREGTAQIVFNDSDLGSDFSDGFNITAPKDALHANDEFGKRVIAQTNVTGETNNTLNFGFQPHFIQPNISFFWDTNRNGVHNPDEPFIFLEDLALWNLTTPNLFTENNLNPLVRTKSRIPLNAMSHDLYFNYGLGRVVTGSNQPDFIKNTMFQITNGQKLGLSSGLFVPLIQIQTHKPGHPLHLKLVSR